MVTLATVHHIREFSKPAVTVGLIHPQEFQEAFRILEEQGESPHRLETRQDAAKRLRCHPKTVSRMIQRGIIRAVELIPGNAKSQRVRSDDVDRVIRGQHVEDGEVATQGRD